MNKHSSKFKNQKILAIGGAILITFFFVISLYAFHINLNQNNQSSEFTFKKCVASYGTDNSNPPKCKTPEGHIYIEFRTKGTTYDECKKKGGEISEGGCMTKEDRSWARKFPEVSTYNECREGYPRDAVESTPEAYICVDKSGRAFYAGGEDRAVNSYEDCVAASGPIGRNGDLFKCYFGEVVYWQVPKPSMEYLNVPYELKTFEDCVMPEFAVEIKSKDNKVWCKGFNNKKYYYNGPKIDSFEDCARVMRTVLQSNPPQCYGPDGKHYIGPRN